MMPSATPNEEVYLQNVNKSSEPSVYRANTNTRTWLVQPLFNTDSTIYVSDVTKVTDTIIQTVTATVVNGVASIGLTAEKRIISQVIVYNNTTSSYISPSNYSVQVIDLSPILEITGGVSTGNSLTITTIEGNLIYINGEQIRFTTVDINTNTITGLQRGANGTGEQTYIPIYAEVYGILSSNLLNSVDYYLTWNNSYATSLNTIEGDPLQICTTDAAIFLNTDIT
jgi:hypothetical protein